MGIVVKSHGGADALAFRYALRKAHAEAAHGMLDRIAQRIAAMPAAGVAASARELAVAAVAPTPDA